MFFSRVTSTLLSVSRRKTAGLLLAALLPAAVLALPAGFDKKLIADKLDAVFITAAPDGRIFFAEKAGRIRIIKNDVLLPTPFADVSASTNNANERGMISVALDKNFATNGYVYATKSDKADSHDYVIRFKASASNPDVAEGAPTTIFDLAKHTGTFHHGMDLTWGPDDKLYVTRGNSDGAMGDRTTLSQSSNDLWGSLLRINPDGTVPSDNPFYAQNQGDARAVWTYGDRNPFSPRFNKNGVCLFDDVMDKPADDELNECKAGVNYGYLGKGTGPLMTSGGGKAQVGGMWYEGAQFPAAWQGKFFFGNSGSGRIRTFDYANKTNADFDDLGTADCPIGFTMSRDGSVYVTTRCGTGAQSSITYGKVFKISYPANVSTQPPAVAGLQAGDVMNWTAQPGAVAVRFLSDGPQSVELRDVGGRIIARASADGKGDARLSAVGVKGMHLLVWKGGAGGNRRTVSKVILE